MDLPLEHRLRPAKGEAEGALVLFHGRGTSEDDLFPLFDLLDPEGRIVGVTPRGPLSLPPGGAHWYVVRRVGHPDPETFRATYALAASFVDALPAALGVPAERIVLGGFSQGAVISYSLGLGAGRPSPAGILAMSGFVPEVEGFAVDTEGREGLPVMITHGTLDPVIGVEFGRAARGLLETGGLDVTHVESSVHHGIDPRIVPQIAGWLAERLGG